MNDMEYNVRTDDFDLYLYQGADESISLQLVDDVDNPVNLSGYSAKMEIRRRPGGQLLLGLATSGSGIVISPATGTISISISNSQTDMLDGTSEYDIATVSPAGQITYLLRGTVHVTRKVTDI